MHCESVTKNYKFRERNKCKKYSSDLETFQRTPTETELKDDILLRVVEDLRTVVLAILCTVVLVPCIQQMLWITPGDKQDAENKSFFKIALLARPRQQTVSRPQNCCIGYETLRPANATPLQ